MQSGISKPPRGSKVQVAATMEDEFGRRLREMRTQHRGPVSEQVLLGWYDSIRCELWKETLAHEQRHQGKILPSIHVRYWSQYEVRVLLLGEQPNQEWTAELSRLIWEEMRLDESYRALHWYVNQVCPWTADDSPTEGFDYSGLGLLYWGLSKDPDFGSDLEWRLEDIMEYRERLLNVSEVSWAQEDLEFLANQEWELEIAYRQLLDSAQQQVWAPFAWAYSEIPADSPKILAEDSAMWQSNSDVYPSPPGAMDEGVLWRIQQVLTNLDDYVPARDDCGSNNLSVHHLDESTEDGAVGSSLHITEGMDLIDFSTEEEQLNFVSVDGTVVATDGNPAEALATGQNAAGLCPQLLEDGGPVEVDGTSVSTDTAPDDPAPEQEDVSEALQELGDCHLATVSTCIPQGCWAVGPDPQQHDGVNPATLTSLQQLKGPQEEGPVYISPPQQGHLMREAEVGWVSNTRFQNLCLGYCVGTDIGGLKLLTNFGVNPSGVSSYVSPLPKGEMCDVSNFGCKACGTQNTSERLGGSWLSSLKPSYV